MTTIRKPRPSLSLGPAAPDLALGRVHEATGPTALTFAALAAGRMTGPVLWIRPAWDVTELNPQGLSAFFDPTRLVIARCPRPLDILWSAEEALRSGVVPLIVAEAAEPPALTPLRRLQLAAEAGGEGADRPPLGLILPPRQGGAGAVESRWRCTSRVTPSPSAPPRWRFERLYGKSGPPLVWETEGKATPVPQAA